MGGTLSVSGKHLEKRNGGWYVARYIPDRLRPALGCRVLRRSLGTRDEGEAVRRAGPVIEEFDRVIREAEQRAEIRPSMTSTPGMLLRQAEEQRQRIAELEAEIARLREAAEWATDRARLIDPQHPQLAGPVEAVTFRQAAERFISNRIAAGAWKRTEGRDSAPKAIRSALANHAGPILDQPVGDITTSDIMGILEKQPAPPAKLRPWLREIWHYAKSQGWCDGANPASRENLSLSKTRKNGGKQHHRAMPWRDVPAFVTKLREKDSVPAAALRLVILTATRKGETAGAKWSEIDLEARTWTIPASRMKAQRDHIVPLSDAALAVLKTRKAAERPRDGGYVFPSRKGSSGLSHNAMDAVLAGLEADCTIHGFRSSFRDWAAETDQDRQASEFCLAHIVAGVEGAYFRSTMLRKRAKIMQQWGEFCTTV